MWRRILLSCLFICLVLVSFAEIKTLKDIEDLKRNVNFVKKFPHHGLMLLHWFSHNVEIDEHGGIRLKFNPEHGLYGLTMDCYRQDNVHPKVKRDASENLYYSLGDLNYESARMLPFYVTQDYYNSVGSPHRNIDRVLIKVQNNNPQIVYRVYLSQHNDPENFYEVSTQLLLQILALHKDTACDDPTLNFSACEFLSHQQKAAKVEMIYPKTPGLARFLILAGYNIEQRFEVFSQVSICSTNQTNNVNGSCYLLSVDDLESQCQVRCKITLEVKSTSKGYARIVWSGIPENVAKMEVKLGLYRDKMSEEPLIKYSLDKRTFGSVDTNIPLNPGFQVHLLSDSSLHDTSVFKGPEFDEANKVHPARISSYDVSLQLYVKDGYACARLYIKKTFTHWADVFDNSWVGFYASSSDANDRYYTYIWVRKFKKRLENCFLDYNIYEAKSSLAIGPGVQARFMLIKDIHSEKARTVPWEDEATFKQ